MTASAEIERALNDPHARARRWRSEGTAAIGLVGADVPEELVVAAGGLALRVTGEPGAHTDLADRWCEPQLDALARSTLQRLLDGTYSFLDRVLVSNDCEASLRVFYYLRELARIDETLACPAPRILDLVHLPNETSREYNRRRLRELADVLSVGDDELRAAIALCNDSRRLLAKIDELRRAETPRLSGSDLVRLVVVGWLLPKREHVALLERVLAEADALPEREGTRVFLTGSTHQGPDVYELIESRGAVVVAEDHDAGARSLAQLVDETREPIAALVDRYQLRSPAVAKSSTSARAAHAAELASAARAEAAIVYLRAGDEGPAWDAPEQRAALERRGIPTLILQRQPYGGLSDDALVAIDRLLAGRVAA